MIIGNRIKEARKSSKTLIKGNKIPDIFKILLVQIIASIIYVVFILLGVFIIIFLSKIFSKTNIIESISITIVWLFIVISLIISAPPS